MEHRCRKHCIRSCRNSWREMRSSTGSTARDNRNRDGCTDLRNQFRVEAGIRAIGIHRIQQDLARAEFDCARSPFDGVESRTLPTTMGGHFET